MTVSRSATGNDGHITADLRSPGAAERAIGAVIERHGRLDIIVNAVGIVAFGDAASTDVDTVEEVFLTNTFAHIFLCQAALPRMTKGGVIVAVSGVVAEQNLPGMSVYGASKAAMRSFNEAFDREARRAGIRPREGHQGSRQGRAGVGAPGRGARAALLAPAGSCVLRSAHGRYRPHSVTMQPNPCAHL